MGDDRGRVAAAPGDGRPRDGRAPSGTGRCWRHRRRGRTPAHPLRGLAGPRRPRGGRLGAPRPQGRLAVGRRRARRHLPHLRRARAARGADPRRLPGPAPVRPLRRVPRRGLGGHPHGAPTGRRAGRDLERHALPLPAVVPRPAHRLPAPRPRRDVGHGAAAHPGPPRRHRGAPRRAALLPLEPDRHAVRVVARRDRRDAAACPRTG